MRASRPVSLNVIRVNKSCPASWDAMRGDERVRFCDECSLHVYNLSAMTQQAAEELVASHERRLCVRYYQRADGTIITKDCGGGLRRAAKRAQMLAGALVTVCFAAVLAPFGIASAAKSFRKSQSSAPGVVTGSPAPIMGDVAAPPPAVMGKVAPVMGIVAPPPATQPTTTPTTRPATNPS